MEGYGRTRQPTDNNIVWRMHIACWITKATNTHSEYVTLIAVQWQQLLYQCAPMFCYTCMPALLFNVFTNVCAVGEFLMLGL